MARLPTPGSDDGTWGDILNTFLKTEHNPDGSQKTLPISKGGTGAITADDALANLGAVTDDDARLSDNRTPTDNSVTDAKIANGGLTNSSISDTAAIEQSKIAGLEDDLDGKLTVTNNLSDVDDATEALANLGGEPIIPNGTYVPVNRLYQPSHMRRWFEDLAVAGGAQKVITVLGDSITLGAYAGGTTVADWRKNGYVTHISRLAAMQFGNVGPGAIKLTTEDDRVTLSGGSTSGTTGPNQQGRQIGAGNTITIATAETCTGFEVAYWNQGGSFTWAIDGGATTTVTPSGTDVMAKTTISSLADTTHTIILTGVGTAHIGWVRPTKGSLSGIVVNRFGRSGATASICTRYTDPGANQTRQLDATFKITSTDLAIFLVGANDIPANVTPADFRAAIKVGTDYMSGTVGGCSLVVAGPRYSTIGATNTYPQATYYAELADLATDDDHVAFFDLADVWRDFETVNAADLDFMHDSIHPNSKGHYSFGTLLAEAILAPQPVTI